MKSLKRLGIWMDHSTANIMELSNDKVITVTLDSTPAFPDQIENLRMDERLIIVDSKRLKFLLNLQIR